MAKFTPKKTKIWNQFDEFGLMAGLSHWSEDGKNLEYIRLPGETNKQLRDRTKEATLHKGNSTLQGMTNNISRDLGVTRASGIGSLPWYNTINRSIFYLSEPPMPEASGSLGSGNIKVYVSSSGSWSSADQVHYQLRASGYADAVSGWCVWHQPDVIPSIISSGLPGSYDWYNDRGISGMYDNTNRYGKYSTILQFKGDLIPSSDEEVMIEYAVQTGNDDIGRAVINWRSDHGRPDDDTDKSFTGLKSDLDTSVYTTFNKDHVILHDLYNIKSGPASGAYYESDGRPTQRLIDLKDVINSNYPLTWDKFRYDIGTWDQLSNASIGVVPSFHDDAEPTGIIKGGVKYGIDLDLTGIEVTSSGARSPWYPKFHPGEFYISNTRHYMYANLKTEAITLTPVLGGYLLSGKIAATGDNRPLEMEQIAAYESGYYTSIDNNPWIRQIHEYSDAISGIYFREPCVNYNSGFDPSGISLNSGNFYYNYQTGDVWASGIHNEIVLTWEDSGVGTSGTSVVYSGGYGFHEVDLNPMADISNKMFYIED